MRPFGHLLKRVLNNTLLSCSVFVVGALNASAAPYRESIPLLSQPQVASCSRDALFQAESEQNTDGFPENQCNWQGAISATFKKVYPMYRPDAVTALIMHSEIPSNRQEVQPMPVFRNTSASPHAVRISLLEDSQPNAFADPEDLAEQRPATIYLSTGLLALLRGDSELAFIIAHEMAHLRVDHIPPDLSQVVLSEKQLRHISHIHQGWELEADREALQRIEAVGYSTLPATAVLERLTAVDGASVQAFGRRHPSIDERIRTLRQFMYHTELLDQPLNVAPFVEVPVMEDARGVDQPGPQAMR